MCPRSRAATDACACVRAGVQAGVRVQGGGGVGCLGAAGEGGAGGGGGGGDGLQQRHPALLGRLRAQHLHHPPHVPCRAPPRPAPSRRFYSSASHPAPPCPSYSHPAPPRPATSNPAAPSPLTVSPPTTSAQASRCLGGERGPVGRKWRGGGTGGGEGEGAPGGFLVRPPRLPRPLLRQHALTVPHRSPPLRALPAPCAPPPRSHPPPGGCSCMQTMRRATPALKIRQINSGEHPRAERHIRLP